MCQYFSITDEQCSRAMKQAGKEDFENDMHHHDTMKTVARAHLSNRKRSVQEAAYHILPGLKLRRISPSVYFVNSNLPGERVQVLFSEKELRELLGDSPNIFRESNIDRYTERPAAIFCKGKYSVLHNFCFAEFLAYYTLENKSDKPVDINRMN